MHSGLIDEADPVGAESVGNSPIANWIRRYRTQTRCSLRDLAERSGVSRSTLSRWERGESHPSQPELDRLLSVAGNPSALKAQKAARFDAKIAAIDVIARQRLLRAVRHRNGVGLRDGAEQLGVSKACLSRWESGDRYPGHESVARAAALFGASADELDALRSPSPIFNCGASRLDDLQAEIRSLRQGIPHGQSRELDLAFIRVEAELSRSESVASRRVRLELRATHVEWLSWWYRSPEAAALARETLLEFKRDAAAPVWGRVVRARTIQLTEKEHDPCGAIHLIEQLLPALQGTPSEAFVTRELSSQLLDMGENRTARQLLLRSQGLINGEEEGGWDGYCRAMTEAEILSREGRHESAMAMLPTGQPDDFYLLCASAAGKANVCARGNEPALATQYLAQGYEAAALAGMEHFRQSLQRRFDALAL